MVPAATPTGGEALALLDNLPALWAALTADEQKTLYRLIFSAIEVADQAIVAIEARGPFRELLDGALARLDGASAGWTTRSAADRRRPVTGCSLRAGCAGTAFSLPLRQNHPVGILLATGYNDRKALSSVNGPIPFPSERRVSYHARGFLYPRLDRRAA